jgi:AI-2 transport protein TqsA
MTAQNIAYKLLLVALVLLGLYVGQHLLIPLVIALVIWYLLNSLNRLFGRIRIGKKGLPWYVRASFSLAVLVTATNFITRLVVLNFDAFVREYPKYHDNFVKMSEGLSQRFNLAFSADEVMAKVNLPELLSGAVDSSLSFMSATFMVLLYVIFLLAEQQIFDRKLKQIFTDKSEYIRFLTVSRKIDESIHTYVSVKTGLCLGAGLMSYGVMRIIGVDFAVLWAFLIFLFNYIPVIGALLGILFPVAISIVQFGGYTEPFLLALLLALIQVIIGNFVEPKVLGSRLNLSPLVTIMALTFWGSLWGIAGMFLCIPITVILMIIFHQFDTTRNIAILLSGGKSVE